MLISKRACAVVAGLVAAVAFVLWGMLSHAQAATITVNTTDDELNADGDCSLREAIQAANTDAGVDACTAGSDADAVSVPAGTYTLSLAGDENMNATGDLDILDDVTISGAGTATTIIDGGAVDRVFDIVNDSDTVMLSDVTVRNGDTSGGGGGVRNEGTLTVTDSTISGNNASSDGGGISSSGPLTVTDSDISENSANTSGGIYFCAGSGDTATITGTTISDNTVPGEGGAIWHECGSTLTIADSTITGNMSTSDEGGAIHNEEDLIITDSIIDNNSADGNGGAIYTFGEVTITGSSIGGNTGARGGGIYADSGSVTLDETAATGNMADRGGGIYAEQGDVVLMNSTVSGNTATDFGGGGIYDETGSATLTNVTVSGNAATTGNGGGVYEEIGTTAMTNVTVASNSAGGSGGGLFIEAGAVSLKNTIVADSSSGGDCGGVAVTSNGNNLDGDGTCGLGAAGDQPNTDPQLGPLDDNGGSTETHALLAGSPAIDAGDDASCPADDQRGVPRPVDGDEDGTAICDIGAYEFEPSEPTPTGTMPSPGASATPSPAASAMASPTVSALPVTGTVDRGGGSSLPLIAAPLGACALAAAAFVVARLRSRREGSAL